MSKTISALNKASEERAQKTVQKNNHKNTSSQKPKEVKMPKSWFTWIVLIAAVVTVLIAFNYQGGGDAVPLSQIFPDEETLPLDVEYEFVQDETQASDIVADESGTVVEELVFEDVTLTEDVQSSDTVEAWTSTRETQERLSSQFEEESIRGPIELETVSLSPLEITPVVNKEFHYTVQIASFKNEQRAETALKEIQEKVYSAFISSHDLGDRGVWHRIYAGQFEERYEAEMTLNDIKKDFNDSFIISTK